MEVRRGALIESIHRGRVAVCNLEGEVLEANGDPDAYVYVRSSAKPFQALPLVLSGTAGDFGLTEEELAVACASHNAEERHLAAVRSILEKAGLPEEALQNGAHPPMYETAAAKLVRNGEGPRSIHGNCSGKHAGMLAVCVHEGWDTESYRDPHHPLQQWILTLISEVCGVEREAIVLGGDGCGVPAFAMPLRSLATGFARISTGERLSPELANATLEIRDAVRNHPFMVAGTGRFDTTVMEATSLVAKSGAEGMFAAGSPEGWGMAIKISDGAGRAVRPAARAALARRGVDVGEAGATPVRDLSGEQVGEIKAVL